MSDVSKTNAELIAEARTMGTEDRADNAAMIDRLADALESATRVPEQTEASVAIERVRAIIKPHIDWQLRRAAKFGRTKPDCGCEQCQIHAALDGAPEPVSVRCGGCRDLGPHNYGTGCEYRQKGESE